MDFAANPEVAPRSIREYARKRCNTRQEEFSWVQLGVRKAGAPVRSDKGEGPIDSLSQRQSLGLQVQKVGEDCLEVCIIGDADPDMVAALQAQFESAEQERRHVLLNFRSCDYVDPEMVALIVSERERLAGAGIDLMHFGASAVIRPLLAIAFGLREEAESRSVDAGRLQRLVPRSAEQR